MLLVEKMLKVALFLTISCWDPHNRTGLGTVRTDKSPSDLRDGREGLRHTLQGYPQGGITGGVWGHGGAIRNQGSNQGIKQKPWKSCIEFDLINSHGSRLVGKGPHVFWKVLGGPTRSMMPFWLKILMTPTCFLFFPFLWHWLCRIGTLGRNRLGGFSEGLTAAWLPGSPAGSSGWWTFPPELHTAWLHAGKQRRTELWELSPAAGVVSGHTAGVNGANTHHRHRCVYAIATSCCARSAPRLDCHTLRRWTWVVTLWSQATTMPREHSSPLPRRSGYRRRRSRTPQRERLTSRPSSRRPVEGALSSLLEDLPDPMIEAIHGLGVETCVDFSHMWSSTRECVAELARLMGRDGFDEGIVKKLNRKTQSRSKRGTVSDGGCHQAGGARAAV